METTLATNASAPKPLEIKWMVALIGFTTMRAFMGFQLPTLQMYGGVHPDAWFAPWLSDTVLGIIAPFMIYLLLTRNDIKSWGILVAYNAVGAFDYLHGLMVQWTDPLVPKGIMGTPELTYGSIGLSFIVQLIVLFLLFSHQVRIHFAEN